MIKNKSVLALIPARGSSKRLPCKNIRNLCGKPLIAWTIEPALKSRYVDAVMVSTDSKKIRRIAEGYGAGVPFTRPKKLALDNSKTMDVVLHAINWLKKTGKKYDLIVLLQPTSPLRSTEDIDKAIKLLFSKNANAVISVCMAEYPPSWVNTVARDGCMKDFKKPPLSRSSGKGKHFFYRLNGAINVGYWDYVKEKKDFYGNRTFAYVMPAERSADIDSEQDFKLAEFLMRES